MYIKQFAESHYSFPVAVLDKYQASGWLKANGAPVVRSLKTAPSQRAYMSSVHTDWQEIWPASLFGQRQNAIICAAACDLIARQRGLNATQQRLITRTALVCGAHESGLFNAVCFIGSSTRDRAKAISPKAIDRNDDGLGVGQIIGVTFETLRTGPLADDTSGLQHWMMLHPAYGGSCLAALATHLFLKYGSVHEALFRYAGRKPGRENAAQYALEPNGLIAWYKRFFGA